MKKLKLFFACLLMAVLSIGQVWADTQAVLNSVSTKEVVTTAGGSVSKVFDGVTCLIQRNSSNQPGFYTSSGIVRYYGSDVMTLSVESGTISQIDFSYVSGTSTAGTADPAGLSGAQWTGSAQSVSFTGTATTKIASITVTYSSGGSTKTLSSVAVSGTPTKTEYYAGQDFDPAGLTVTGTYSDASQQTFTSGITWAYNPSQTLALNQTSIGVTATVSEIASAEFTVNGLTVTEAPAAVNYELVTDVADLADAAEIIIVNIDEDKAISTNQASNNRTATDVSSVSSVITPGDAVQVITLEASSTNWKFNVGADSYLYASSSSANQLKTTTATTAGDNGVWSIAIASDGAATILAQGSNTRKLLRYNPNGSNPIFACYADNSTTGTLVKIFKKVEGSVKPSAELAYADAQKLAKLGVAFTAQGLTNPHSVTVSYASDNTGVATVDPATGAVTIKAVGVAVITASFAGNDDYKAGSASYTIFVAEQAGTNEDPLTEASAKALIDLGCTLTVHVNGLVLSQNATNFTVTLTNGFQFYKAKDLNNVAFESAYLGAGDEVTAVGALKKFSSTYELDEGCYLTFYEAATTPLTPIANDKDHPYTVAQALAFAAAPTTYDLSDHVFIQGVVYKANSFNSDNGTYNIYIKDAGTSEDDGKFEFYKCAGLYQVGEDVVPFEEGDVQEGDEVIGYGVMTYYSGGSIWEFGQPNQLVSLNRPAVAVTGVTVESTASVAIGGTVTLHAAVVPENASNKTIVWSVQSGNAYASVADGVVTGIEEGTAVIRAASDEDASIYAECTVTVAPLSPWATVYTSNIELSVEGGTSASVAKVKFDGEETEYAAIKAGVSATAGAVVVSVPAGATALHFHAYSWNTEDVELTVTAPAGVTVSPSAAIAINKNSGISGNTPFTLEAGSTPQFDAYYAVSLSGNSEPIDLTISATSGKRFVLFGVNQEGGLVLESIAVSGTATNLEYNDGNHFNPAGLVVTGTYSDASTAPITEGISWAFDPDPLTEGTTSVSVTATAGGFTSAAFVVNGLTVHGAAPLSPWATTWTSNLDDITGSKVKFYSEETEYAALKAGTGSVAGTATLNIPAQATELHLHAYGWNSEDVTLSITAPAGVTVTPASITLNRNSGFASNSPFTLAEGSTPQTDAYYALSLSGNTDAIELTITATAGKRFLLFGVNQVGGVLPELQSIAISGDVTKKSGYKVGNKIDPDGLTVMATSTLGGVPQTPEDVTAKVAWSHDPLTEGQTEVTLTATYEGKTDNIVITLTEAVASADPAIYVDPSLYVNFGSVVKDAALPADKSITVTLTNVAAATATLGGTNPEAFSIDKTALVEGENVITISVASTATAGSFSATITLTDNATENPAPSKTVNLSFTVTNPATEETPVSTTSKWVPATEVADGIQVLIVGVNNTDYYAMGAQTNNNRSAVAASVDGEGVLTPGENTMAFTVVAQDGGKYALRTSNGKYLYAASSSSNYLRSQDELDDNGRWTLTVSSAVANGTYTRNTMFFNSSSTLFACYASTTTTQQPIALYVPQTTPPTPTADYSRDVTIGNYGTICLPKAGTISGAKLYDLEYFDGANTLYLLEVNGNAMEAGKPYIFLPSVASIHVFYTDDTNAPAGEFNGLVGSYTQEVVATDAGNYILLNNEYHLVNSLAYVGANRAYIHMAGVPTEPAAPAPGAAPRRRVAMSVNGENAAQGIEDVQGDNVQSTKVLINGNLYILRGEKVFDATGRLVK